MRWVLAPATQPWAAPAASTARAPAAWARMAPQGRAAAAVVASRPLDHLHGHYTGPACVQADPATTPRCLDRTAHTVALCRRPRFLADTSDWWCADTTALVGFPSESF